jgi:hypothetical protein
MKWETQETKKDGFDSVEKDHTDFEKGESPVKR